MLIVLFSTIACYTIKENINKNHFAEASHYFGNLN